MTQSRDTRRIFTLRFSQNRMIKQEEPNEGRLSRFLPGEGYRWI